MKKALFSTFSWLAVIVMVAAFGGHAEASALASTPLLSQQHMVDATMAAMAFGGIITERRVLGMFYEKLMQDAGLSWIDPISTPIIRSDQDSEDYGWLGQVPQMSESKGEKQFSQLRETDWNVKNVEYQGGLAIPLKHVLYDKTDQVRIRVNELAARSQSHWASLVAPLIINGESTACYDGQYYFDTDHSEGDSGTQSNDVGASATTATAPTASEMIDGILTGVEAMLAFKDDRGEYVNEGMTEFMVLCGTPFLDAGLKGLGQSQVGGGNTNILIEQDSFNLRLMVSPRLSSWTTKMALFATQGEQKPIIRQQRVPNNAGAGYTADGMRIVSLWDESEHCKKNNECLMSIETERAVAYGDWKKSCLVTFS